MTDTIETASQVLRQVSPEERAELRDWFDQPGLWAERMSALYRLVEHIAVERMEAAWEQGWVARGNEHAVTANPYTIRPATDRRDPA